MESFASVSYSSLVKSSASEAKSSVIIAIISH